MKHLVELNRKKNELKEKQQRNDLMNEPEERGEKKGKTCFKESWV